jgi:cytochrome c
MKTLIGFLMSASILMHPASAADVDAGEQSFKKCRACHEVGVDAKNKAGPLLNGLFGRAAGSVPGFRYSDANRNSGVVWSEEIFSEYIRSPRTFMPGTRMAFVGLKKDDEIANLTAYLRQFRSDGSLQPSQ